MTRAWLAVLGVFFFLSGATGLVYEIIWMRQLILVFGSTTYAVSSVLSAFMLGLAIGSFALGRLADRGANMVRIYGWLEIGVGLYALVAPYLLEGVGPFFASLRGEAASPGAAFTAARFAGSLVVLLPPTILMGGTLPVLSRVFASPGDPHAGPIGRLYAINTFGAVAGTFLAGFVLLPNLGMRRSTLLAVGVNIALGLAALGLARSRAFATGMPAREATEGMASAGMPLEPAGQVPARSGIPLEPSGEASVRSGILLEPAGDAAVISGGLPHGAADGSDWPGGRLARWSVLLVFACSGFAAMIYEVGWSRVLALTIGSSVYGFTLMLVAFLAGLAAGAALFAGPASRPGARPARLLGLVLAATGGAAWCTSLLFQSLPYLFARLYGWTGGANLALRGAELGLCLLVMFPATVLMGGVFPLVLRLHAGRERQVGRRVGEAYAANTVGTVLGSAAAGFALLPGLGVRSTLLVAVGIDLLLAAVLLAVSQRRSPRRLLAPSAVVAAGAGLFALSPSWDPLMMNSGVYVLAEELPAGFSRERFLEFAVGQDELLYYREGMSASVLVGRHKRTGTLYLKVNGKADASTGIDMKTQILLGQIPLLFHPQPRDVMVIGLASGISVASAATHPVERLRVIELEPAMIDACRLFGDYNRGILSDPRVSVVINDARNEIRLGRDLYDVIISEPSNPWMTVAANLFTREFFEEARARIRPDGIFCQWFQVYSLSPEDLRSLIATFRAAFPHVLAFGIGDASDLVVLGSMSPLPLDYQFLESRMSDLPVAIDLARASILRPEDLLANLYLAPPALEDYARGARLNTDDNALIEFSAPLSLHAETVWANQREILSHPTPVHELLTGLPSDRSERRRTLLSLAESLTEVERSRMALRALEAAERLGADGESRDLRTFIEHRLASE